MTSTARKSRQGIRTHPPESGGFGVNPSLTAKRPVEPVEYASAVIRMVRALGRRGAAGDVQAAVELDRVRKVLDQVTEATVQNLRQLHGYSWGDIGQAFGVSRQAAQQRWGKP